MTIAPVKCRATSRQSKRPCKRWAVAGAEVCTIHGGASPQVQARAQVRIEVHEWGLQDVHKDPGEVLLRLVTQSARRVQDYSARLAELVEEHGGDLVEAMIGDTLVVNAEGDTVKVGEYIRGLAQLEAQERDRCATFATKAVAAGLAKRQVELAERQGALIAEMLRAALTDPALGLTAEQRRAIPDVARRHVLELVGG